LPNNNNNNTNTCKVHIVSIRAESEAKCSHNIIVTFVNMVTVRMGMESNAYHVYLFIPNGK